jgi:hypothetical protein
MKTYYMNQERGELLYSLMYNVALEWVYVL